MVRGHTGTGGDAEENVELLEPRRGRARVPDVTYNVDPNRIRVLGFGSSRPLPRLADESDRAYEYRLPRVEVSLLSDDAMSQLPAPHPAERPLAAAVARAVLRDTLQHPHVLYPTAVGRSAASARW